MKCAVMASMSTYRRNTYLSHGKLLKQGDVKTEMGGQVAKKALRTAR